MGWKIAGILCMVSGAIAGIGAFMSDDIGPGIACILVFIALGCFLLYKGTSGGAERAKEKGAEKAEREGQKQRAAVLRASSLPGVQHMTGLPLSEGTFCNLVCQDRLLIIEGGGNTFRISLDKVTDSAVKSDVDIEQAYVSSVGGAVGGALLFGPLGAIVGGRAKKKTTRTYEYYLIVTYRNDNQISCISFQVADSLKAMKFSQMIKERKGGSGAVIDL